MLHKHKTATHIRAAAVLAILKTPCDRTHRLEELAGDAEAGRLIDQRDLGRLVLRHPDRVLEISTSLLEAADDLGFDALKGVGKEAVEAGGMDVDDPGMWRQGINYRLPLVVD